MVPAPPNSTGTLEAATASRSRTFLSSEWRDLLMLNYEIDPALLQRFVPRGTELDSFDGITYVSLVGLRFARTKLFGGIAVPFHTDFDEVSLRIYVRSNEANEIRRGVVFIKEIVSLPVVTFVARTFYRENYATLPLRHSIDLSHVGGSVEYSWESRGRSFFMCSATSGHASRAEEGSLEQFISEHYWGLYSATRWKHARISSCARSLEHLACGERRVRRRCKPSLRRGVRPRSRSRAAFSVHR